MVIDTDYCGPVVVHDPRTGSRIGYYDDDEWDVGRDCEVAIVYFSEPPFLHGGGCQRVPYEHLAPVDTDALWTRREKLHQLLFEPVLARQEGRRSRVVRERRYEYSLELSFVNSLLADRMLEARMNEGRPGGRRVFISYSSLDQLSAIWLSVDLANAGHRPWLDEWEIKVGESIPSKIALGVEESATSSCCC